MFIYIHIMYMTVCAGPWALEPTAGGMSENGHQMWSSSHQMWLQCGCRVMQMAEGKR